MILNKVIIIGLQVNNSAQRNFETTLIKLFLEKDI